MQFPVQQGKENAFIEEKKFGRAIVNRVHVISLAGSLPGKKKGLSFSYWALLLLPILISQLDLIKVSVYPSFITVTFSMVWFYTSGLRAQIK